MLVVDLLFLTTADPVRFVSAVIEPIEILRTCSVVIERLLVDWRQLSLSVYLVYSDCHWLLQGKNVVLLIKDVFLVVSKVYDALGCALAAWIVGLGHRQYDHFILTIVH